MSVQNTALARRRKGQIEWTSIASQTAAGADRVSCYTIIIDLCNDSV